MLTKNKLLPLILIWVCFTSVEKIKAQGGWVLNWSDEFNYTGSPVSTKWGYEIGYVRNNEPQYYQSSNATVNGSNLVITVKANDGGHSFTSASVTSATKKHFTYGKLEIRAKVPIGTGAWPAWWLLGANYAGSQPYTGGNVSWPACGEIDIMEIYEGLDHNNFCNATGNWNGSVSTPRSVVWASSYHTWSMEWDATKIKLFVDGALMAQHATDAVWKLPQYMIFNVALRGSAPATPLPVLLVDYVRYYVYDPNVNVNEITDNDLSSMNIFPNPAQESVEMSFTLSHTCNAELAVYDLLGKVVKVVMKEQQLKPGEHNYPFDISALEPGIYICKLNAGGIVTTKKLIKE